MSVVLTTRNRNQKALLPSFDNKHPQILTEVVAVSSF